MKYRLLEEFKAEDLEAKINKGLEAGWELSGGLHIRANPGYSPRDYQAMTKRESK